MLTIDQWKSKRTDKGIKFSEMTEDHLQKALYRVQIRKLKALHQLKVDNALEKGLLKEIKARKIEYKDLSLADNPRFSKEYADKKEVLKTLENSIKRKEKALANVRS
jgi:hypothetical protein